MDIWIVVTEDRHADVEVTPFAYEDSAVSFAEREVIANAMDLEDTDREVTARMRADGCVWYYRYSVEGDYVAVVRRELRTTAP